MVQGVFGLPGSPKVLISENWLKRPLKSMIEYTAIFYISGLLSA